MANTTFVTGGKVVSKYKLQRGDRVVVVNDGSKTGNRRPDLTNGNQHMITDVRDDGMVSIDRSSGWYYDHRFVLDPAYTPNGMPRSGGQAQIQAGPLAKALMGSQQAQGPDPGKPFPDPVAEREKTAEEKLREYRKSVRDFIGGY